MKMKSNIAMKSAPRILFIALMTLGLAACGGGGSADDGADPGLDGPIDTGDLNLDNNELGGGTDTNGDGFIDDFDGDGISDDLNANGIDDSQELLFEETADQGFESPCGPGNSGTDPDSSDFEWNNNCVLSRAAGNVVSNSQYTRGVQRVLFCRGLGGDVIDLTRFADGLYGMLAEAAVEAFQMANGLDVDGRVGAMTWGVLQDQLDEESAVFNAFDNTREFAVSGVECFGQANFVNREGVDGTLGGWLLTFEPGSVNRAPFSIADPSAFNPEDNF